MPHIVLEYSTRLAERCDIHHLLLELHGMLGKHPSFETDRIKNSRDSNSATDRRVRPKSGVCSCRDKLLQQTR